MKTTLYKIRNISQTQSDSNLHLVSQSQHSHSNDKRFDFYNKRYNNYNPNMNQCISTKGYCNCFLSVFCNGKSVGYNELFYTIPMENNNTNIDKMHIKTHENLYLCSDENGFLFFGNVRNIINSGLLKKIIIISIITHIH